MKAKFNCNRYFPFLVLTFIVGFVSCNNRREQAKGLPLTGTWKLLSGTLIENGDTVITDYTTGKSFIKIINDTHFSFTLHDLNKGAGNDAVFAAGAGRYTLRDSLYTEHLEYCSDRNWEGHDFSFVVNIRNDTLTQSGTEIIESEGISRMNIERYIRLKP